MSRPPDSRASLGQRLEDEDDAITEGIRLQTRQWIAKLMRSAPSSDRMKAAVIAGISGGLLDELWDMTRGDTQRVADTWASFSLGYLDRGAEDAAADAEPVAGHSKGGADA